ncbi:MAG: hypothetical protein GY744_20090 [Gammaproteobacteria bacterium]|nr:hypothetical protein [Gammaproteobacteria bacterium]
MKWLVIFFQILALPICYAIENEGQKIYLDGLNGQGQVIKSYINDLESGAALACVNCHRESGLGTSESGKTIPPVSWNFLGVNQPLDDDSRFYSIQNKRKAYDVKSLQRLLTTGINSNGDVADPLMPRYVISEKQTEHLVEYLKTLYAKNDPGVDSEVINIATVIDSRLTARKKQQHLQFMQRLFDMKNSLTRGELKRKKYSPVQKIPQYESYRHWNLVAWELKGSPDLWQQQLKELYKKQPVFVILSPFIKSDYSVVGSFCDEMEVPCLFAHGSVKTKGDYYNFVFRDTVKQQKDFLDEKIRQNKNNLLYFDFEGKLQNIKTSQIDTLEVQQSFYSSIEKQFNEVCGIEGTIITKVDINFAQHLHQLKCPVNQKIKILMLMSDSVTFKKLNHFLHENSNSNLCWVTDYGKMLKRDTRTIRADVLTRKFGMENTDSESLLMNLYAYSLLTDSIHQLAGHFSRAYLLEIIEHMLNSFPNYTYFNSVSGAPKQRAIVGPVSEYCPQGDKPI